MRAMRAALVVTMAAAAVVVYMYEPAQGGFYPECLVHRLTGLYCPGCGSTRAVHQLLHGNLTAALKLNPLTVVALPFILYGIALEVGLFHSNPRHSYTHERPSVPYASIVKIIPAVTVLFWILRNIPLVPFTLLRPH
ncbi:MAG: DUF2752 domain-containing protein [Nitrospirae bacterium]|nr:DUF2752 domain-containing protein [Nitrospirota bacterium]